MSDLFRRALESHTEPEGSKDTVVMSGPLGDIYTDALNKALAKKDPAEEGVAMESAANDELMLRALAEEMGASVGGGAPASVTTVYGVSAASVQANDVVNVSKHYAQDADSKVVLILDGVKPGPNSPEDSIPAERVHELHAALESYVKASGGEVYYSLVDFARARAAARQ